MQENRFVIITGLSGAGKTQAMRCFEDLGYFCIDNLPPTLIPKFAELCLQSNLKHIALVVDIRGGEFFDSLTESLESVEPLGLSPEILFLEADDRILIRRFKESRRRHPFAPTGSVLEGIAGERLRLASLKARASKLINTSNLSNYELKREISKDFAADHSTEFLVTVVSFGFKHGIPMDADLLFDVRFLPNPYYVEGLRECSGNDKEVVDYLDRWPQTHDFYQHFFSFMEYALPNYQREGRSNLVIAIGCTGGRHRSVAATNALGGFIRSKGYNVLVEHRDLKNAKAG
jgi:UPF0042 nucleotide-binding protein